MVYSSKDFESLWFLYQAEGLPKNISIKEFCTKHGVDFPTFEKCYKKTHKKGKRPNLGPGLIWLR